MRPFNTFGPRQSARAIVPTIISQALERDVLRLGSLDTRRDLTFISDTVAGFLAIAECDAALGRAVNVGRGEDVSIGELVTLVGKLLGRELRVETDRARLRPAASEVGRLLCDADAARTLFDWTPRVSLADGLAQTIDWIRENRARYRVDQYTT